MPISPYCARETIGGTSAVPRPSVGDGDAVADGEGASVAEAMAVGAGLVLAGATQPATAMDAATRTEAVRMASILMSQATASRRGP